MSSIVCSSAVTASTPYLNSAVLQHRSAQDFVLTGSYMGDWNPVYWIANYDGHGDDTVINVLRHIDHDVMMRSEDPLSEIKNILKGHKGSNGSGSTVSLVKIFADRVEVGWIGDSEIIVSEDGNIIFKNKKHDMNHTEDVADILKNNLATLEVGKKTNTRVIDDKTLELIYSKYMYWHTINSRFNMTRALGHGGVSDESSTAIIHFKKGHKYTIFTSSDGVGDMLRVDGSDDAFLIAEDTTPMQIAEWAKARWEQPWSFKDYDPNYSICYPKGSTDDISCALFKHTSKV